MPPAPFLLGGLSIVLINLLLAGDNALVIALAARALPPEERRWGVGLGVALAVVLRIALTALAARMLRLEYLQLLGGLFVLWIAWKLLGHSIGPPDRVPAAPRLWQAVWYVTLADLSMSVDNILAIAGASRGNLGLLVFGLGLSIPFVVFSSNLLVKVLNRFPALAYLGVAILGIVAGDMVMADPAMVRWLHPTDALRYAVDAVLALALVGGGQLRLRFFR
ncbi:MAG: YjbE family putative metal transport protein [Bryobacteraceae bacterium]|jgi:YjbE family integral membrane protein